MRRSEAYWILGHMYDEATAEQKRAIEVGMDALELLDLMTDNLDIVCRCKDCKYQNSHNCPMCHEEYYVDEDDGGDYYLIDKAVDPDGFCSYGERRGDG